MSSVIEVQRILAGGICRTAIPVDDIVEFNDSPEDVRWVKLRSSEGKKGVRSIKVKDTFDDLMSYVNSSREE